MKRGARGARGTNWRVHQLAGTGGGPELDPYIEWARATGFAHYGAKVQWLPVLVQLKGIGAQAFASLVRRRRQQRRGDWTKDVVVPALFDALPKRLRRDIGFVAMQMKRSLLVDVFDGKQTELASMIRRIELSQAAPAGKPSVMKLTGKFVPASSEVAPQLVVAVIDDAIPFAHERLRVGGGGNAQTRIEYLWDQQAPLSKSLGVGRELRKRVPSTGLDALMAAATHNGQLDEDEVYRLSGFTGPDRVGRATLAARFAHGAHVADLACFDGAAPPPAGERPIVAVQLPAETVADTSGATLGFQVFLGLLWALHRTETIEQSFNAVQPPQTPPLSLPLLANVSYGVIAGPHDGSGILEAAVDRLLSAIDPAQARFHVLLPSGNNHLSRCHAQLILPGGVKRQLRWRVLPDDLSESLLVIRLPAGAQGVRITVTTPEGDTSPPILPGHWGEIGLPGAPQAFLFYPPVPSLGRVMVSLMLAPTAAMAPGVALASAGLWRIGLQHQGNASHDVHAWVQRDDVAPGFARQGRQSHFDDAAYARFDDGGRPIDSDMHPLTAASRVKREGTQNAYATGKRTLVVGAFRCSDGAPAEYSAGGKLPPPGRGLPSVNGPDALLPGDDSPSQRGVLGAGTRSGSCVAMSGTSVATPLALRRLTREVVAGKPAGRHALYGLAQQDEAQTVWPTPQPPSQRGGGGRLREPSNRPRRDNLR
jgi:hypothetical protein